MWWGLRCVLTLRETRKSMGMAGSRPVVGRLTSVREAQLQRANLILNPPDRKSIMALDHDKQGVDELEFVVGMLMSASLPSLLPLHFLRLASEPYD